MNSGKKKLLSFLYSLRQDPAGPRRSFPLPRLSMHRISSLCSTQLNMKCWNVGHELLLFSIMFFFRFAPCVVSSCFHPLKFQRYYIFSAVCCWVETRSEMCSSPRTRGEKKYVETSQQLSHMMSDFESDAFICSTDDEREKIIVHRERREGLLRIR